MAIAGAEITSQYVNKDIKTEALILPITALLYRSFTLVPNNIRDACCPKICQKQDKNILRARPHAKRNQRRTVDLRRFRARILPMWYPYRIMKLKHVVYLLLLLLSGCASTKVSPGATFLVGLSGYQDEMERLERRPELWADRQRAGDALKRTYVATIGTSREFNRMVDLDVRRREVLIMLRDLRLKPDRVKEMKDELVTMNRDVDELKEIIKGQTGNAELRAQQQPEQLETVVTIGLVSIAIDSFSFMTVPTGPNPPSTKVGPYVVSDFGGLLSTITTPAGQTFRCTTLLIPETGASIKCEPPGKKS